MYIKFLDNFLFQRYLLTKNDHPGIIELLILKLKDGVIRALNVWYLRIWTNDKNTIFECIINDLVDISIKGLENFLYEQERVI